MAKRWTKAEEEILKDGYKNHITDEVLSERLGRTPKSVWKKAQRMGIATNPGPEPFEFSQSQMEKIEYEYVELKRSAAEIADDLGVSKKTIIRVVEKLGKSRNLKQANRIMNKRRQRVLPFSELYRLYFEECRSIDYIAKYYKCGYTTIMKNFERHGMAVMPKHERLKMRDEFRDTGKHFGTWRDKLEAIK